MLRPWIDVGSVGDLTLCWLEDHFGAEDFAKLAKPGDYFDFTRYRPMISLVEDRRELELPNSTVKYAKRDGQEDLLFVHLLEPHISGDIYVESVYKFLKSLNVKRYCLVGSMYDVVPHTRELLVTGSASEEELQDKLVGLNTQSSNYEGPTTILYRLFERARKAKIETLNLMVHLPQYTQLEEDYSGELRLLEIISQLYNFNDSLHDLRSMAEKQYLEVSDIVAADSRLQALLTRLEERYDLDAEESKLEKSTSELSPEVERFLREVD
jgi:predicted ATP-grasp superfamily ATP-dependent carboligase